MKQYGATLIYVIGALVILGAIAAGIAILSSSATRSGIQNNYKQRAFYLAASGQNLWLANNSGYSLGIPYTFITDAGNITIKYAGIDASARAIVQTLGVVNPGKGDEANQYISTSKQFSSSVLKWDDDSLIYDNSGELTINVTSVTDLSVYKNTGTAYGITSKTNSPVTSVTGKVGSAFYFFCGQYARVVFPDISAYDIFYSGTIMLWFNADNFNNQIAGLLHKGESTNCCTSSDGKTCIYYDEVYTLQFWPYDKKNIQLLFSIIDGGTYTGRCNNSWNYLLIKSNTKFNNANDKNKWYHVAVTWIYDASNNRTKLALYINGVKDSETVWVKPFKPRANSSAIVVGAQQNSSSGDLDTYFCGKIDELNVYNIPLSSEEISSYYSAVSGR